MGKRYLFLLLFMMLPLVSAVEITDTIFFASETNFTIFVDFISLDEARVIPTAIQFHNLTSIGSNFTNINETFDARADFIGLATGLVVRNINTSEDLFISRVGDQDFNATFTPGQQIRIMRTLTFACSSSERSLLSLTILFFALGVLVFTLMFFFVKGKLSLDIDPKIVVIVFVGLIMGLIFIQVLADGAIAVCS